MGLPAREHRGGDEGQRRRGRRDRRQIRIVAGAVQCVPRRLTVVEEVVRGQAKTAETASLAGQSAVRGATPLNFNHFKIPLLQNLVTRAIRDA